MRTGLALPCHSARSDFACLLACLLAMDEVGAMLIDVQNLHIKTIIGGDFNVIPEDKDVDNPEDWANDALFKLEIRKEFRKLLNLGFKDSFRLFDNKDKQYTFWDYQRGSWNKNKGLRIDHFLVSQNLINDIKSVKIDKYVRALEKPSDHAPIKIHF